MRSAGQINLECKTRKRKKDMNKKECLRFSVWTATYNRCSLLVNVYKCLLDQKFKNFEWIIIDDGSVDETEKTCKKFISEAPFSVTYIKQNHSGKHNAWRKAIQLFHGKYAVTIDDDDILLPDALMIFDQKWNELENSQNYERFWEIKGMVMTQDGNICGEGKIPFENGFYDSDYNILTYKNHFMEEMHGCRKVTVLKEFDIPPFIFENECSNFCEGIIYSRIARKYKTRFIQHVVRIYNQNQSGLSGNIRTKTNRYNNLVGELYKNNEQKDLMQKYERKEYYRNLALICWNAIHLNLSPFSKEFMLDNCDRLIMAILFLPIVFCKRIKSIIGNNRVNFG